MASGQCGVVGPQREVVRHRSCGWVDVQAWALYDEPVALQLPSDARRARSPQMLSR